MCWCHVSCSQGTYCLVESVLAERDIAPAGEQLVILLGFKTTNKVETEVIIRMRSSVRSNNSNYRDGKSPGKVRRGGIGPA